MVQEPVVRLVLVSFPDRDHRGKSGRSWEPFLDASSGWTLSRNHSQARTQDLWKGGYMYAVRNTVRKARVLGGLWGHAPPPPPPPQEIWDFSPSEIVSDAIWDKIARLG